MFLRILRIYSVVHASGHTKHAFEDVIFLIIVMKQFFCVMTILGVGVKYTEGGVGTSQGSHIVSGSFACTSAMR